MYHCLDVALVALANLLLLDCCEQSFWKKIPWVCTLNFVKIALEAVVITVDADFCWLASGIARSSVACIRQVWCTLPLTTVWFIQGKAE